MEDQRDERLWRIANERAHFRKSLYTYLIVNTLLWFIWWFTGGNIGKDVNDSGLPWPLWVMIAWGFGLALNYYRAFHSHRSDLAEKEYERLKQKKEI